MRHGPSLLNVMDVEATCWDGQPPPGSVNEIIEIGLTVVDLSAGRRSSRHRVLVRPARSSVSGFCTELTGLTQAEVDRGVTFAEACRILVEEYGAGERPWASWGDYDRRQFARQSRADGVAYPFGFPTERTHTNAKAVFAESYGLRRKPGMDQPCASPDCRWRAAITAARTTRGTSPRSCWIWWAAGRGPRRRSGPAPSCDGWRGARSSRTTARPLGSSGAQRSR